MTTARQKTGRHGEALAATYLQQAGYTLLAQNWRRAGGELDIIATEGEMVVFIEVRTRQGSRLGSPEESITPAKQAKLTALAYTFLAEQGWQERPWRIDVIAIELTPAGQTARFNHLKWAIEG